MPIFYRKRTMNPTVSTKWRCSRWHFVGKGCWTAVFRGCQPVGDIDYMSNAPSNLLITAENAFYHVV